MPDPKPIHIALAFDQNFWAPAYATARSICLSTRRRKDLVFHLCHTEIDAQSVSDLDLIAEEFGATVVHHDIGADADYVHFAETLPHTRFISAVTYARLMFTRTIPDVLRLTYLDCDMLVRAPIEEIAEADLGGKPMGAVKDPHALRFANGRDGNTGRDLFDPADPFFNAGLLVIDLDAWRRIDVVGRLYALEKEGILTRLSEDQQMLNYIFKNNWHAFDKSWNMHAVGRAQEALDPKLVHYTGRDKPWNLITLAPFNRVYRHVMTNELYYRYARFRRRKFWSALIGRQ
jgi:lipopolysaccharide biosynthesis glycosyltransferase